MLLWVLLYCWSFFVNFCIRFLIFKYDGIDNLWWNINFENSQLVQLKWYCLWLSYYPCALLGPGKVFFALCYFWMFVPFKIERVTFSIKKNVQRIFQDIYKYVQRHRFLLIMNRQSFSNQHFVKDKNINFVLRYFADSTYDLLINDTILLLLFDHGVWYFIEWASIWWIRIRKLYFDSVHI